MINIAYCGNVELEGYALDYALEHCAEKNGFSNVNIMPFENPLDLVDAVVHPKTDDLIDLVVCGVDLPGMEGIELVRDIRKHSGSVGIVMCSRDGADAYEALALRIDSYLLQPTTPEKFCPVVGRAISRVSAYHTNSIIVRSRDGMRRIRFSQFLYSETADHDQAVHLTNGKTINVRVSSQAFFEMLQHDKRFFKAGSSYIVNVNMVRFVDPRSSTARLVDGTVVSIPVRVRKSLEEAIMAN